MKPTSRSLCLPTLALCAALLAGCAATVTQPGAPAARMEAPAAPAKQVIAVLSSTAALQAHEDWAAFREEWQTAMSAATAQARMVFTLAADAGLASAEPATLLRIKVKDFRYVSQAKRFAVGVFSGNASMDVEVEFVELPSGRVFGTRNYALTSSAWQGVFAAMTPKQVQATADQIVAELKRP